MRERGGVLVLRHEEVDVGALRVKKPFACDPSFTTFNVCYGPDNRKLLLQSPAFMTTRDPFVEPRAGGRDRLTLYVGGGDKGRARREGFLERLADLEDRALAKLVPRYPDLFDGKTHVARRRTAGKDEVRFRHVKAAVRAYDAAGKETPLETLERNQEVALLLEVAHVWTGSTHYGVEVRPVQVMRVDVSLPSTCSLLPPPPAAAAASAPAVALPEKYAKMLKLGIPRQAVEHAMTMDGVVAVADGPAAVGPRRPPPPPPPRPPPPPPPPRPGAPPRPPPRQQTTTATTTAAAAADPMGAVMAQINEGRFKLRSAEERQERPLPSVVAPSPTDGETHRPHWTRRLVPSLSDILGAKQRLRNAFSRTTTTATTPRTYEPHNTFPFLEDIRSGRFALRKT